MQRFELDNDRLPFELDVYEDIIFSYIANAVVCGPVTPSEALLGKKRHPLESAHYNNSYHAEVDEAAESPFSNGPLRRCVTSRGMVPVDPWLYSLLGVDACFVYGAVGNSLDIGLPDPPLSKFMKSTFASPTKGMSVTHWFASIGYSRDDQVLIDRITRFLEALVTGGIGMLGHDVESVGLLVSVVSGSGLLLSLVRQRKPAAWGASRECGLLWERIEAPIHHREWLRANKGCAWQSKTMVRTLKAMELKASKMFDAGGSEASDWPSSTSALFVAEIKTRRTYCDPQSLLSKVWNECLGPRIIPFDPADRAALIEHGRKHPRLGSHINAWEEMKRTGSKWATGKWQGPA